MSTNPPGSRRRRASIAADDDLSNHALAMISFVYNRVIAGAAPAIRKRTGLSVTEARIIFQIGVTGSATGNKIARILGLDKAAISRGIARLVELGWISSDRDPSHAARNILTLTDAGEAKHAEISRFTFAREKYLLEVLTEGEEQLFVESLRKVLINVEPLNKLVASGHFWE